MHTACISSTPLLLYSVCYRAFLIQNKMDNFLTKLYYERFQLTEKERKLMNNHDWEDSERGKMDNVRNDQSISEVRHQSQMIDRLIEAYVEKIKSE
jgi:hypothetical protein